MSKPTSRFGMMRLRDGLRFAVGRTPAHGAATHLAACGEGKSLILYAQGDLNCELYLDVFDMNGGLVACDHDGADVCLIEWTPRQTSIYRLDVRTRHGSSTGYALAIR